MAFVFTSEPPPTGRYIRLPLSTGTRRLGLTPRASATGEDEEPDQGHEDDPPTDEEDAKRPVDPDDLGPAGLGVLRRETREAWRSLAFQAWCSMVSKRRGCDENKCMLNGCLTILSFGLFLEEPKPGRESHSEDSQQTQRADSRVDEEQTRARLRPID